MPAVLLVLGLVIGSVQISAERVALTALAGDVARLEARGDGALAAARVRSFAGDAVLERSAGGGILCVTARTVPRAGLLAAIAVAGSGCAAMSEAGAADTGPAGRWPSASGGAASQPGGGA